MKASIRATSSADVALHMVQVKPAMLASRSAWIQAATSQLLCAMDQVVQAAFW
eukprot:CAMPEP_0195100906 /NCGR_PEP_ID=MMETSP0448-20130528/64800_1 /TAXON_ID=66468 /ORGANISM="Heterocapsa triquestra, Strain CCMP 448" /LENGTH=52 /DNA_ID=CAMNT_0040136137 /DNA_START=42 /DNA_END=198 /DNA_ORIENTATION=+